MIGRHFVLKLKVTVRTNAVGVPFNTSGEYLHCIRASLAALSRYLAIEKKLSARKNHPLVILGSQLARSAAERLPPIFSTASE